MSFVGNAASAAGKAAAQKGAQKAAEKGAQKGAEKAVQKGAQKAAEKSTQKLGEQAGGKLGDATTSKATQKAAEKTAGSAQEKSTQKLGDTTKKADTGLDPKSALKDTKAPVEKSAESKIDDAKHAEKQALKDKGTEQKGEHEKGLIDKAKDAKRQADERSRVEEQTAGGKAKSIVRDVGGGAAAGAVGGAAVGATAGGVGAAPGAMVGAAKGAASGIIKNKTTRGWLIVLLLAPVVVAAVIVTTVFGIMQNMMLAGVELSGGGSDSMELAVDSGIEEEDVTRAFTNSDQSLYPWTLTTAWEETMKGSGDESVRAFPSTEFAKAMEEVDPQLEYREISVKVIINQPGVPDSKGGFVIKDEKASEEEQKQIDEKQAQIKEKWVAALLKAGTPPGATEGVAETVDAPKVGENVVVYGDSPATSSTQRIQSVLPATMVTSSPTMKMSDAADRIESAAKAGTLRPYIVVSAASTETVKKEDLQRIYDAAGESHTVVFVTGYNQPKKGTEEGAEEPAKNDWIEASNTVIRDFVAENDRARLADWGAEIAKNPEWLDSSGYMVTDEQGKSLYANLVKTAVDSLPTVKMEAGITEKQAETIYDRALALYLGVGMDTCGVSTQTPIGEGEGELSAVQLAHVKTAMGVAKGMFPDDIESARQAALISLMTMKVETQFKNYANSGVPVSLEIDHDAVGNDHDSVGLMQQRVGGSWGNVGDSNYSSDPKGTVTRLMTPSYAIGKFITVLVTKDGWLTGNRGELAQSVQVSAFPDRYQEEESFSQSLMSQYFADAAPIPPHEGLGWNGAEKTDSGQLGSCGALLGTGTMGVGAMPIDEGNGAISSLFGPRDCSDGISSCNHGGLDIAGFGGTSGDTCVKDIPVYSISSGVVELAPDPGYGSNNAIAIKYSDQLTWRYLHMGESSFKVKVGDQVTPGQQIGSMGSYGASTGCHLHIETAVDGTKVDPLTIIEQGFGVTLPR